MRQWSSAVQEKALKGQQLDRHELVGALSCE